MIPAHIATHIRAEIRAINDRARAEQTARTARIATAARIAGTEWNQRKGRIPGATTAAAHIATACSAAAKERSTTP